MHRLTKKNKTNECFPINCKLRNTNIWIVRSIMNIHMDCNRWLIADQFSHVFRLNRQQPLALHVYLVCFFFFVIFVEMQFILSLSLIHSFCPFDSMKMNLFLLLVILKWCMHVTHAFMYFSWKKPPENGIDCIRLRS